MKRRAAEGICGKRRGMPLMASHEGQASCRTGIDLPQQGAEDIPNDLGMIRQETGQRIAVLAVVPAQMSY